MTNMFAKVSARIFILFVLINVETSFALDLKRDVEKKLAKIAVEQIFGHYLPIVEFL